MAAPSDSVTHVRNDENIWNRKMIPCRRKQIIARTTPDHRTVSAYQSSVTVVFPLGFQKRSFCYKVHIMSFNGKNQ